jgi:hypothetical protein
MANLHTYTFRKQVDFMNKEAKLKLKAMDKSYDKLLTASIYLKDITLYVGKRYIKDIDFNKYSHEDINEILNESWPKNKGYSYYIFKTYSLRKNLQTGEYYYERYDTIPTESPSCVEYWK